MINLTNAQVKKEIAKLTKWVDEDSEIKFTVNFDEGDYDTQVYLNIYVDGEHEEDIVVAELELEADAPEIQKIAKRLCKAFNAEME